MKNYIYAAILVVMLGSCKITGTLYPISENNSDFIFKKELIGKWGDKKDPSVYFTVDTTAGTNGKSYTIKSIEYSEHEKRTDTTRILARLVSISNSFFLDCQINILPELMGNNKNYQDWLIMRHFIIRLNFHDPENIEISFPDPDELKKLIDQKKITVQYTALKEDDYLIIDKPEAIQKALSSSLKYPLLYKEKTVLQRLK